MIKKISGFVLILVTSLILLSGCGGNNPGGNSDQSNTGTEIEAALSGFEAAVEAFDANAMLANFSDKPDVLNIRERSFNYYKDYSKLKEEVSEDAAKQQKWSKPASEGGYGYILDMVMGTLNFSNLSDSGGVATQTFEVWESATDTPKPISRTNTDKGTITWQMVKTLGEWKVVQMTIQFDPMDPTLNVSLDVHSSDLTNLKRNGFGFNTMSW